LNAKTPALNRNTLSSAVAELARRDADLAEAGGKDPERLPEALAAVPEAVGALLS